MGDEANDPGVEALRDRLRQVDWGAAYLKLTDFAISWCRASRTEADDAIQAALARLWAGTSAWDPLITPSVVTYLTFMVRGELSNARRLAHRRLASGTDDLDRAVDPSTVPAEALARQREEECTALAGALRAFFADDPAARGVLDQREDGVDKPAEQAARLGIPVSDVYDASDRIKRRIRRVLAEQARQEADEEVAQ